VSDWTTVAELGTAVGTLVLAGATFAAVRSANRTALIAERTLSIGLRPVLIPSGPDDRVEEVQFADGRSFTVGAGRAMVKQQDCVIYLAIPLRNVGAGIAVLRAYRLESDSAEQVAEDPLGPARHLRGDDMPDPATFTRQQRDLYVPAGRLGFWQAALRDPGTDQHVATRAAIGTGGRVIVDLLYGDHEGGQPTIARFVLLPGPDDGWRCDVTRHWSLDGQAPQ
jgi:hypothetical protein